MQDLIKRYFWILGAAVVLVCAVFAAKATSHVVEATVLGVSAKAPRVPVVMPVADKPAKQTRNKDGGQLAARNMFCSECTPQPTAVNADPSQISTTSLPLVLIATMVGNKADQSYAVIANTENLKQGAYEVGEAIPGASGKLTSIHYQYVEFENNGHVERLVLAGSSAPVAVAPVATEPTATGDENKDELQASIDNGIKKTGDNTYDIDKALVDKVLANPMAVAKGARVVPAVKNNKPDGFKLYAIRPSSVYSKLGLMNGDTLQSINGFELNSADKALEVYTKLREASNLEVEVTRRGKPMTLKYSIR